MNYNDETLICVGLAFYNTEDETMFFEWVKKIDCIEHTSWINKTLHLRVVCMDLYEHNLRDLLALFYRYHIDMKQLQKFLTQENRPWFYENKNSYWHMRVFGNS